MFVARKPHPLLHCQIDLLPLQCPHQVVNNKGVAVTPTMVVLALETQPAAVAQRVSSRVKKSLALETKLVMYMAQLTVFA